MHMGKIKNLEIEDRNSFFFQSYNSWMSLHLNLNRLIISYSKSSRITGDDSQAMNVKAIFGPIEIEVESYNHDHLLF